MRLKKTTKIVWFTGLSGTGKTTLSKLLDEKLKINYSTKLIDGDNFRRQKKFRINLVKKILFIIICK